MNFKQLYLKKNECYKSGNLIIPKGIMISSTGENNPFLKRYVAPDDGLLGDNTSNNHWNQSTPDGKQICVHAFIGKLANGSIATYQTLPWDVKSWHSDGSANDSHISFKICESDLDDKNYFDKVYRESIEFCAYLCVRFKFDPLEAGVLLDYSEGYVRGLTSDDSGIDHWFSRHNKNMDIFRNDVKNICLKK